MPRMPYFISGGTIKKALEFTRAMDAASGNVAYAGFGFLPTKVMALCKGPGFTGSIGYGISDRTASCHFTDCPGSAAAGTNIYLIFLRESVGKDHLAIILSYDADGFTLTWTRVGATAAGTVNLLFIAFG